MIPFDSFPNRVTTANYRRILESARDANMNMIRQWGGGYYESDEFYQICDELGIMVWQDFRSATTGSPGTYAFKLNIEAEAEDQVRRLRNHPSIVLWCGNNETEEAIDWGQRQLARRGEVPDVAGLFDRIQRDTAPRGGTAGAGDALLAEFAKRRLRGRSRPFHSGDDARLGMSGMGACLSSTYETHQWRFVTEYGFQSFPEMKTVETFTQPEDRASIFAP